MELLNRDVIAGRWNEIKGRLKTKWGKLTDDDFKVVEGNFEEIKGKIQRLYGYSKERAETELRDTLGDFSDAAAAETKVLGKKIDHVSDRLHR